MMKKTMKAFFLIFIFKFFSIHATNITYPPLWNDAPSNLNDYPLENQLNSSTRIIDPWFYPHRLGLYKILINITTPMMPFCSSSNASNILFGLPSQFGWQFQSNRLFTNETLNISVNSWWASGNYYLSVIPFLAAINVSLIPFQSFRLIRYENFCINSDECLSQAPNAMKQWRQFFRHLQNEHEYFNDEILDQDYLGPLWMAYQASIQDALPNIQSKLDYLPSNLERAFGSGWIRLLNLIAMTRKNTNLYETLKNQRQFLPPRLLRETDRNNFTNDLSISVVQSLEIVSTIQFKSLLTIEKFWQKLTCNHRGRMYAQKLLETLAKSKIQALGYLIQALVSTILFPCDYRFNTDL